MSDELDPVLEMHDDLVARRGVDVWVGADPTFTRTDSLEPAWIDVAEGDDKLTRAHAIAVHFADAHRGAAVSRVIGRERSQTSSAPQPEFVFGVRWRDGQIDSSPGARAAIDATPEPPPADLGGDHWLTVAPEPGVIEISMAPSQTTCGLARQARDVWGAAAAAGLSPLRHRFNGDVVDCGGGCQLTLGGSRPETSPFVRYPHVLPALIRYLNNHPALSYWFAGECVGSASQGPRPDEGTRERWDELALTLDWLERLADRGELPPEQLWHALAPLLVDAAGNAHRAELSVEKLWNPHHHGRMGVLELRAIRMPERPSMLVALAALFRSIVARLVVSHYREPLVDWHDELHDRFALPSVLHRDLRMVLGDLDEHGLGVPVQLRRDLELWRPPGIFCRLGDATLELRPALEFWPLIGDVAEDPKSARLVDASTQRWELVLDGPGPERVVVGGKWVQLRPVGDGVRAIGVRRRVYQPAPGFHPGLPTTDPLVIEWSWAGRAQHVELWAWKPRGGPYDSMVHDEAQALERRRERIRVTTRDGDVTAASFWHEARPFTIDIRRHLIDIRHDAA